MSKTIEIIKGVNWVGSLDPGLRRFDILLETEHGSTYNSYLVKGANKTALIDTTKHGFEQEFIKTVKAQLNGRSLDYLVVNHTEPDHSYATIEILKNFPEIMVYATKPAIIFLKNIVNADFKYVIADDGSKLDLGGKKLQFIKVPFLHWPDTMFTYLEEDNILFSCDGFGSHFCDEKMFNDLVDNFDYDSHYYYDMIVRPFKAKVLEAIKKVIDLQINIDIICPSHGPILRDKPSFFIERYAKWSQPLVEDTDRSIMVLYNSAHENTKNMAYKFQEYFKEDKVVVIDAVETPLNVIRDEFEKAKVLLVGSPTILGDVPYPIWHSLSFLPTVPNKIKIAAAFGSYGWSGEAVKKITSRLKDLKLKVVDPGVRVNFIPNKDDFVQLEELAEKIKNELQ